MNSFTLRIEAINNLIPGHNWEDCDTGVTCSDGGVPPTEEEIQTEIARLQTEYDAQEYARNRQAEYPSIGDQLDALFHAGIFPAEMAATIQAVKDKYPKV
jgi:hypothetical protein